MPHRAGHNGPMVSRLTIRGRLTLWYTALFAVTGAAVLTLMYLLVRRALYASSDAVVAYLQDPGVTGTATQDPVTITQDPATVMPLMSMRGAVYTAEVNARD